MTHGVTKGEHDSLTHEYKDGSRAAFLRSDSLVAEMEPTNEVGWESTPVYSTKG